MANVVGWYAEVSPAVTVPRMSATALLRPPLIVVNSTINLTAPPAAASASMITPGLGFGTTVAPPAMTASASMAVPTLSNAFNISLNSPRMAASGSLPVPGVGVAGNVTAPRMAATGTMAVPTVSTVTGASYGDTFNRADASTLGAAWNTDGTIGTSLTISSNAATPDSSGLGGNIYATAMLTGNNQITVVMKGTPATADQIIFAARVDSATSTNDSTKGVFFYMIQGSPWTLYRSFGDSTGVSTTGAQSWANGDTIDFFCVGATLTVKKNGTTILTTGGATDLAAGYVSLLAFPGTNIGFDSFTATDI
jgi:hypothetical protein